MQSSAQPHDTLRGVACGAGAGSLWGLVFLAPELATPFGPLALSAGRYLCFGLVAAALLAPRWRALRARVARRHWLQLAWLALAGNTLYYLLLAAAVQNGGVAMSALVMGFLPVAVTVIGSRDQGAVPLRRLWPSLAFCLLGGACIGWQALAPAAGGSVSRSAFGLACALGALVCWTGFAVGNARCLARAPAVSAHDWNLLTGLMTGLQALPMAALAVATRTAQHGAADWARLATVSAAVALLASVLGNLLWNRMSRLLPLTFVGQMILFETFFALLYGLAWETRLPTPAELACLGCVVLGVLSCLAAHRRRAAPRARGGKARARP